MRIDGKELAQEILEKLTTRVDILAKTSHIIPHLGVIVVGDDPATASYVRQKERMGKLIGAIVSVYKYPITVSEKELLAAINFLQSTGDLQGLIVQLPLPKQLNEATLTNAIHADKDVDGFREDSKFNEPIAEAVIEILKEIYQWEIGKGMKIDSEGVTRVSHFAKASRDKGGLPAEASAKAGDERQDPEYFKKWLQSQNIVVMGKGKTGGKPITRLLRKMKVEPRIIDSKTQNPGEVTRSADILICAVGSRGVIIHEGDIKKDAILIGIGMSLGPDGKLHGDYSPEEIETKAKYYTPIPGGVGPVNAAMLLSNTVMAAERL